MSASFRRSDRDCGKQIKRCTEKGVLPEGICTDAGKYGTPAKEVAWFVEKNDYRNKDKDWGNSADSIQRGMQKCAGGYPADEVFRAKL